MGKRVPPIKMILAALFPALLLSVALVWWHDVGQDRYFARRFGTVVPGVVYRSGQIDPALIERVLRQHRIQVVVDLTKPKESESQRVEKESVRKLGITRLSFPMPGSGCGTAAAYAGAITAIEQARRVGKPVLVHCAAGSKRTGGVVACYEALVEKRPMPEILSELARYDLPPSRNEKLMSHLNDILPALASALETSGVIQSVPRPLPVFPAARKS